MATPHLVPLEIQYIFNYHSTKKYWSIFSFQKCTWKLHVCYKCFISINAANFKFLHLSWTWPDLDLSLIISYGITVASWNIEITIFNCEIPHLACAMPVICCHAIICCYNCAYTLQLPVIEPPPPQKIVGNEMPYQLPDQSRDSYHSMLEILQFKHRHSIGVSKRTTMFTRHVTLPWRCSVLF